MKNLKMALKRNKGDKTIINVNGAEIGKKFIVIAGPCAVESEEQLMNTAEFVKRAGAHMLRGGAFKPRSNPYSFQGLGEKGLGFLKKAREKFSLPIVTEAMSIPQLKLVEKYADVIQIGARSSQNFELLKAAGKSKKPVLLKRGLAMTIEELLASAEYIMKEGNRKVILCERGIRTFETYTRNTLDLGAVAALKTLTHLPIIVDPSHAAGRRDLIIPLSKAAKAVGADGIIVETHIEPQKALCDAEQQLNKKEFVELMNSLT